MKIHYPEIAALQQIYQQYKVRITADRSQLLAERTYYPLVHFELAGQAFSLFVDDEFTDLARPSPLLHFCLILRELEGYVDTPEYTTWCKERFFDLLNTQVKEQYQHLGQVYQAIEGLIGTIDSQISDFDFGLNAGAAQALRRAKQ